MVFAKIKNFFAKLIFSRQILLALFSLFQNTKKKSFGGKKINLAKKFFNLAKKVGPYGNRFFQSNFLAP
jgi:hypothetical protein